MSSGKSTFFDLVKRGKIAKVRGLRGYYRLNESLRRLGLPAVQQIPSVAPGIRISPRPNQPLHLMAKTKN
jgi:hypothetical protein